MSIEVDPPSEHEYYNIESIRLTTGGSTCPGCDPEAKVRNEINLELSSQPSAGWAERRRR